LCSMPEMNERAVLIELPDTPRAIEWEAILRGYVGTTAQGLRNGRGIDDGGESVIDGARAADGLLLELLDGLPTDLTDWRGVAKKLGAVPLDSVDVEAPGRRKFIKALYEAWRTGPDHWFVPADAHHHPGWIRLAPFRLPVKDGDTTADTATSPAGLWREWVAPLQEEGMGVPPKVLEALLGRIGTERVTPVLGVEGYRLMIARHGRQVAARFWATGRGKNDQPGRRDFPAVKGA
jgi:hypothetical protein